MIDPYNITDLSRTDEDLAEFWVFCMAVAGKKASMISGKIVKLRWEADECGINVLELLGLYDDGILKLRTKLEEIALGKYGLLVEGFRQSYELGIDWFRTASIDELMTIRGVGPKTARFFAVHSRENVRAAVIDTHILKFLRNFYEDVPASIPTGKKYLEWEEKLLKLFDLTGMTMHDFDLSIWKHYASGGKIPFPKSITRTLRL